MRTEINRFLTFTLLLTSALAARGQNFDMLPLYNIAVKSDLLTYSNIVMETPEGLPILRNEIPQNQQFSMVVQSPEGFRDSAGWVLYGLEYTLMRESGEVVMHTKDIFKGGGIAYDTTLKSVSLNNTFNADTKAGTKLKLKARLFDRNGSGFVEFECSITVVSGSKKLPSNTFTYYEKDSRGMKSTSVGLHFNFFEFKGLEGNLFMYRLPKKDALKVVLKGMDGWRATDGRVSPLVNIELYDVSGTLIESSEDITAKTIGETMPSDKKELEIEYRPLNKLSSGQFYYANIQISDRNSRKSGMGLVVKFYVED